MPYFIAICGLFAQSVLLPHAGHEMDVSSDMLAHFRSAFPASLTRHIQAYDPH